MPARCNVCNEVLDDSRAMIIAMAGGSLPCVCLKHSSVQKPSGFNNHVNAGELIIMPQDKEGIRRVNRELNRAR